jgi:hypothetical protein
VGHENEVVDPSRRRGRDQRWKYRAWKGAGVVAVVVAAAAAAAAVAVVAAVAVAGVVDVAVADLSSFVVGEASFHPCLKP